MRNVFLATTIILATACGTDSQPVEEQLLATTPIEETETEELKADYAGSAKLVATVEGLECSDDNDGHLVYVTGEGAFRYCEASTAEWLVIDLKGEDAPIPEPEDPIEISKTSCLFEMRQDEVAGNGYASANYNVYIDIMREGDKKIVTLTVSGLKNEFGSISTTWFKGEDGFTSDDSNRLHMNSSLDYLWGNWSSWIEDGIYKVQYEKDPLDDTKTRLYDVPAESCTTTAL
jgi:hypothetical protein